MASPKENLHIPENNKVILSLDGGGIRGILTLQLLKRLEEVAGAPCHTWADVVAGTSTGGIIAGMILARKSAAEIEQLYVDLVSKVFTRRDFFSGRFLNPPKFDKKNYRTHLEKIVGNLTLEEACGVGNPLDMIITAKDMAAGEETFFTCFHRDGKFTGTYKDVLLRAVMETTMSAPTYFSPFERFIDGGTTTFNNPAGAAVLEAVGYSGKGKYKPDALTVFSFGTGIALSFIKPADTQRPKGLAVKFWLNYIMNETGKDASEMQVDMLRSNLMPGLDFRRYQISFDQKALSKIPDRPVGTRRLSDFTDKELADIDMADVSKFPLMKIIGEAVADYICRPDGNWFRGDLVLPGTTRDQLVTALGDVTQIRKHLASASWLDSLPTG